MMIMILIMGLILQESPILTQTTATSLDTKDTMRCPLPYHYVT